MRWTVADLRGYPVAAERDESAEREVRRRERVRTPLSGLEIAVNLPRHEPTASAIRDETSETPLQEGTNGERRGEVEVASPPLWIVDVGSNEGANPLERDVEGRTGEDERRIETYGDKDQLTTS